MDEPENMSEALDMIEKRGIEQSMEQGMKTINMLHAKKIGNKSIKCLQKA